MSKRSASAIGLHQAGGTDGDDGSGGTETKAKAKKARKPGPPKKRGRDDGGAKGGKAKKSRASGKGAASKSKAKGGGGGTDASVSPASPAEACYLILGEIESHECAGPFLEPVSELDAPGYFDVIQEPMDLATVRQRLPSHFADAPESGHEQFAADVRSIWANCKQYNDEKSDLWKWAHRIGRFFEKCYAARVLKPAAKAAKEADKAAKRAALAASKAQPGHDGRAKAASGSARGGNAARGGHGAGSGRSGGADAAADRRAGAAVAAHRSAVSSAGAGGAAAGAFTRYSLGTNEAVVQEMLAHKEYSAQRKKAAVAAGKRLQQARVGAQKSVVRVRDRLLVDLGSLSPTEQADVGGGDDNDGDSSDNDGMTNAALPFLCHDSSRLFPVGFKSCTCLELRRCSDQLSAGDYNFISSIQPDDARPSTNMSLTNFSVDALECERRACNGLLFSIRCLELPDLSVVQRGPDDAATALRATLQKSFGLEPARLREPCFTEKATPPAPLPSAAALAAVAAGAKPVDASSPSAAELKSQADEESRRQKREERAARMAAAEQLITKQTWQRCAKVMDQVCAHELAEPFLQPVPLDVLPDYLDVVSKPMDLGTVRQRLEKGTYSTGADSLDAGLRVVAADVRLVWANCKSYNQDASEIYKWAKKLEAVFERLWRERVLQPIETARAAAAAEDSTEGDSGSTTASGHSGSKRRKSKKARSEGQIKAPQRPASALLRFFHAHIASDAFTRSATESTAEIAERVAKLFVSLTARERQMWAAQAEEDRKRYDDEVLQYNTDRENADLEPDPEVHSFGGDGDIDTFGLDDTGIMSLLEGLDGSADCPGYVFQEQREDALVLYRSLEKELAQQRAQRDQEAALLFPDSDDDTEQLLEDMELAGADAELPPPAVVLEGSGAIIDTLFGAWDFAACFADMLGIVPIQLEGLEAMVLEAASGGHEQTMSIAARHNRAFPLYDEICVSFMRVLMLDFKDKLLLRDDLFQNFAMRRPLNALSWPELARQYLVLLTKTEAGFAKNDLQGVLPLPRSAVMLACSHVLSRICAHPLAGPFLGPVDPQLNPNYNKIVTKPMHLRHVGHKLLKGYGDTPSRFAADMHLIFSNAKLYNAPTSDLWQWAHILQVTFEVLWQEWVVPVTTKRATRVSTVAVMTSPKPGSYAPLECPRVKELCVEAAERFKAEENAGLAAVSAEAHGDHFAQFTHPAFRATVSRMVRRADSAQDDNCNDVDAGFDASISSPVFFGYYDAEQQDMAQHLRVDQFDDEFRRHALHAAGTEAENMERLARLIQQEDIEAWSWSDRALLLQILTESVARSRKLREHNDSEREIRMDLSDSKSASEHMWTRTGSALLGVDRHHNEYWAFGSSTPLVFSRLKESGTWAVYNDSEPLLAHFSSAGLRESFLRKKLLAHRTRQNAGKATMRSLLQKSVLEQPLFSRTGRLSVLACFEHCGDSDASQQKAAMNTLAKHSVHVRGTPYLEAMQERLTKYEREINTWQNEHNRALARADVSADSTGGKKRAPVPFGWGADQCVFAYMRDSLQAISRARSCMNTLEARISGRGSNTGANSAAGNSNLPRPVFIAAQSDAEARRAQPQVLVELPSAADATAVPPKVAKLREEIIRLGEAVPQSASRNLCWNSVRTARWKMLVRAAQQPSQLLATVRLLQGILSEDWIGPKWHRLTKSRTADTFAFVALEFYMLDSVINYSDACDDTAAVGPANMQEVAISPLYSQNDQQALYVLKRSVI